MISKSLQLKFMLMCTMCFRALLTRRESHIEIAFDLVNQVSEVIQRELQ